MGHRREGGQAVLTVFTADEEGEEEVLTDRVVVAVGVQGNVEGLGLEEAGVATERGLVTVDEHLQTTAEGVYAVGDVNGKLALAHVASAQGIYVVERLAGLDPAPLDYGLMPRAVYCQPQVASFGMTEQAALDAGLPCAWASSRSEPTARHWAPQITRASQRWSWRRARSASWARTWWGRR